MTPVLTGALDLGAARADFMGSPALSASVFLFEAGSGTMSVSTHLPLSLIRHLQFDPWRL